MNELLPQRFAENVHRLALGLELIDAARGQYLPFPVEIRLEGTLVMRRRYPIERHDSGRHVLLYRPGLNTHAVVRCLDDARRYVPRRLRIPLPDFEADPDPPLGQRSRRPALFPGAAYDVAETSTGLRGRVRRGTAPLRWARIEATRPDSSLVVGRAFGDDRGEFLLLIASEAMQVGDLITPLPIEVTAFGPAVPPPLPPADVIASDPLWDVPLEQVPDPALPDTVSTGATLPAGYTASTSRVVNFVPGRIISSEIEEFVIP